VCVRVRVCVRACVLPGFTFRVEFEFVQISLNSFRKKIQTFRVLEKLHVAVSAITVLGLEFDKTKVC
jgi:hypothetical protein